MTQPASIKHRKTISVSTSMDLIIRTEASPRIGHGHVMRCLSLAMAARSREMSVAFAPRGAYATQLLESLGEKIVIQGDTAHARFVVRDFRDGSPEGKVHAEVNAGATVLLVDDPGPARQVAQVVADALMTPSRRQRLLHSSETRYLYGPAYALLRSEFARFRREISGGRRENGRLMVALGGRDPDGVALRYLKALRQAGFRGPASIVLGEGGRGLQEARQIIGGWDASEVWESSSEMAAMMARSNLLVTKVGTTLLEGFCLGLGCLLIEPTDAHLVLQDELVSTYAEWPAIELGLAHNMDFHLAADKTLALLCDKERLAVMSHSGERLVDGLGAERIVDVLLTMR